MMSSTKFIGYLVSIETKNVFYQGVINSIDPSTAIIQLKNCFQNGLNLGNKLIDIKTNEIDNIEILADPQNAVNILKPTSVDNSKDDADLSMNQTANDNNKSVKIVNSYTNAVDSYSNGHHHNHQHHHHQSNHQNNNYINSSRKYNSNNEENCFNGNNDDSIADDFDFEKNLALFDKNAFYEEIGHVKPISHLKSQNQTFSSESLGVTKSFSTLDQPSAKYHQISLDNLFSTITKQQQQQKNVSEPKQPNSNISVNGSSNKNYRFDEMVLGTGEPVNFRQIQLPKTYSTKTYVTDDGFIIPCIDYKLRELLVEQSYNFGFNKNRQIECMGRCCAEMCLHLLGGSIRFLPKNNHQKPSILVLVNSNSIQGIYAICAARLLSTRSVKIYMLIMRPTEHEETDFKNELNFFKSNYDSTSTVILNHVNDLSSIKSIDLILNGLESFNETFNLILNKNRTNILCLNLLNKYILNCKASVLSIDPPSAKENIVINSKWCLTPILPMEMSKNSGRVYLCDFGFTKQMFKSVNIKYQSPFGSKFVIPLHND